MPESMQQPDNLAYQTLQSLNEALLVVDPLQYIRLSNSAAQELLQRSEKQLQHQPLPSLFLQGDGLMQRIEEVFVTGRGLWGLRQNFILNHLPWQGEILTECSLAPIYDHHGSCTAVIVLLQEKSRQQHLEAASRQTQRLQQLIPLAAGLAHEIKNPLASIRGAIQLLQQQASSDQAAYYRIMLTESERINSIIQQLEDLGRPPERDFQPVPLSDLLLEISHNQKPLCDQQQITLELDLDPSLPPCRGNEEELRQLFGNLLSNAREAIGKQGRIQIHCRLSDKRPGPGSPHIRGYICTYILDNGPGLDPSLEQHLGTPYYTTKPQGTGLGLCLCQKIVSDHQGIFELHNREDGLQGACAVVELPWEPATI